MSCTFENDDVCAIGYGRITFGSLDKVIIGDDSRLNKARESTIWSLACTLNEARHKGRGARKRREDSSGQKAFEVAARSSTLHARSSKFGNRLESALGHQGYLS